MLLPIQRTRVANIRDLPSGWKKEPRYVYIGRGGPYGNPVKVGNYVCPECGDFGVHQTRGSTLVCYEAYLRRRIAEGLLDIFGLQGKTLVCFCKPDHCHGDIIVKVLEENHAFYGSGSP